ncbi:uncharacterized protein LOC105432768 [Pogonomyrmex barbatus]|uniref:Uncharacterized protein LOC105432768 n=1 Tax=Pogonomyrmex barbatus TaxID=144034 RepID=A0A6I9WU25_9HYME|nr:uncharacterized protein LOC105432768 [Pogonomyrmex barbatus]
MCSFSGDKASKEILRVKWLSLLPPNAQRFLKIFSAPNLDELAIDHLLEGSSNLYVSTSHSTGSSSPARHSQTGLFSVSLKQVSLTLAAKSFLALAARRLLLSSEIRCRGSAMHHALLIYGQSAVRTVKLSRLSASEAAVDSSNSNAIVLPSKKLRLHVHGQPTSNF